MHMSNQPAADDTHATFPQKKLVVAGCCCS